MATRGGSIFVGDLDQGVLQLSHWTGAWLHTYAVPYPTSCLLGPTGTRLYAAGKGDVFLFDTILRTQLAAMPKWDDVFTGGMAISRITPERLGLASVFYSHPTNYYYLSLADRGTLQLIASSPAARGREPGGLPPPDVAFTDTRVLVRAPDEHAVMQADLPGLTWQKSIQTGTRGNGGNAGELTYSGKSMRGYFTGDDTLSPLGPGRGRLVILDPATDSAQAVAGFDGDPTRCALTPDESQLIIAVADGQGGSTLDSLDVQAGTYNRAIYTFSPAVAGMTVVDLRIVPKLRAPPWETSRKPPPLEIHGIGKTGGARVLGAVPAGGGGAIVVGNRVIPVPPPEPYVRLVQLVALLDHLRDLGLEETSMYREANALMERELGVLDE